MPVQGVKRFLVLQADDTFQGSSSIPSNAQVWPLSNPIYWVVAVKSGQSDPTIGYVATYDNPAQPWLGAVFNPPAPVYPPLATLKADAVVAITDHADSLFAWRNGSPRIAQQNFESLLYLRSLAELTESEAAQLVSLEDLAARNQATNDRVAVLVGWVDSESSQAVLAAFLQDVSNPPDGLGWPE